MLSEAAYQKVVTDKLAVMFPDCLIMLNDPRARQGIPDILILWGCRWAMLEVKRSEDAPIRPNQEYYVEHYAGMSFASFIYPEIEADVLHDLHNFMHS
jgi:hypothetical protein